MSNNAKKQYLVTGVTSGMGYALSVSLLDKGHRVLGFGRDESKIQLLKSSSQFTFRKVDLTTINLIEIEVKEFCSNHNNKFDGMVHCAGKEETIPLSIYKPERVKELFEVNVFSGIELLRVLSKKKYSNDGGSMVLLSSVMGELGQQGKVGYCSSKSAVLGTVRAAALELAKRKIRVNAISPGVVNTPMTNKLFSQLSDSNLEAIKNMHPLGIGEVNDVTPSLLFLLSNEARWITGQNIVIDGGYSIQ